MPTVFLLAHSYFIQDNEFEEKLIGFYTNLHNAKQAILRLTPKNGFKDHPNDFVIRCLTINEYFECNYLRECGREALADEPNVENNPSSELEVIDFLSYEHSYKTADNIWQDDIKFFGVFNKQNGYNRLLNLQQKFTQGE